MEQRHRLEVRHAGGGVTSANRDDPRHCLSVHSLEARRFAARATCRVPCFEFEFEFEVEFEFEFEVEVEFHPGRVRVGGEFKFGLAACARERSSGGSRGCWSMERVEFVREPASRSGPPGV
eukprot:scaffold3881_cov255-Pinguiococcus_pyrenoidosus.AAC.3